jgi:hypothetical protein
MLCVAPLALHAQDFKLLNRDFQVHGFATQGYVITNGNNWLTMYDNGGGSGEYTDFGANVSVPITDKLRAGAQLYDRNLGSLGKWHPQLDWGYLTYRPKPWAGIRLGKVKTVMGLYNDTQDLDFLHVFALMPQSVYPTDLRQSTIAHLGGDLFGDIDLKHHLGALSYTAYAGERSDGLYGGYSYFLDNLLAAKITKYGGLQYGGDLRWQTPVKGVLIGASRQNEDITGDGKWPGFFGGTAPTQPYHEQSVQDWENQYYARYSHSNYEFDFEWRRYWRLQDVVNNSLIVGSDIRGWYVSGTYQLTKRVAVGSYYSHYQYLNPGTVNVTSLPGQHDYDKVVTGRIDINRFFNFKIEGHFMDGYGGTLYPDGFYSAQNATFTPNTNALVFKTGFNF